MGVRTFAVTAIGALIVIGAGWASAPRRIDVDFARAPQAPKSAFASATRSHPPMPQIVLAAPARRVALIQWNGSRPLLVAPTKGGGFCRSLAGPYGGGSCILSSARPIDRLDPGLVGDAGGPIALEGTFFDPRGTRLVVRYQDGRSSAVPILWVGGPIDVGLFVFPIPAAQRRPGHLPRTLVLYGANGTQLASTGLGPL